MWNFTVGLTGSGPLLNFASGAGTARSAYLINEPAITRVPRWDVRFGNRPGPPIVDQLSARDGPDADVKFNSERHDPGHRSNRRVAPDAEFNSENRAATASRAERSAHSSG